MFFLSTYITNVDRKKKLEQADNIYIQQYINDNFTSYGTLNNVQVNVSHPIVHFYYISYKGFPYILY